MSLTKRDFIQKVLQAQSDPKNTGVPGEGGVPVIIWGCGSLSYSVKKYLERKHIPISCYLVDGQNGEKDGLPIYSREKVKELFPQFDLVFGHSKYQLKSLIQSEIKNIRNTYCLPNLCYGQYQGLDRALFMRHADEYWKSYMTMGDGLSQQYFIAFLQCMLSGNIYYILDSFQGPCTYFQNDVFSLSAFETYVDIGAYDGDTISEFLRAVNDYAFIVALEPEIGNFRKLQEYIKNNHINNLLAYRMATWNEKTRLKLALDEEGSGIFSGPSKIENIIEVDADRLDAIMHSLGRTPSMIKINFLEGLKETIQGMRNVLRTHAPKLAITVGFDARTIMTVPPMIKSINKGYRCYLRFAEAMPARLMLLCI